MSSLKFGTSGLRGLVVDLVGQPAYDHATAFLDALASMGDASRSVLVGRDLRGSSAGIAATVASAVVAWGRKALDCGEVPTPALALEAARLGCPAIMVTGSHIPDDRNGLKFYTASGEITKDEEKAILLALASRPMTSGAPEQHLGVGSRYLDRYLAAFAGEPLSGWRVGIYQHSTVARDLLVDLVAGLGGTPVPFGRSERFLPVDTEAHRAEDLEALGRAAAEAHLDAIMSADGDADRPLLADGRGRIVPGDALGTIAARHLGVHAVAVPVTANSAIESAGGFARVVRTSVGSPFVISGMERATSEGATSVAGFEANGGFLLGSAVGVGSRRLDSLATRDAILPMVAVLDAARAAGTTLETLVAGLGFKATASHRLQEVPSTISQAFLGRLRDAVDRDALMAPLGRVTAISEVDGVRLYLLGGSVIHFRVSGNAPELRCYAEADTKAEAERIVSWGLSAARTAMA